MPLEGILSWWNNWKSKRVDDRMIEDAPPTPVIVVGAMGSGGETLFGASSTVGPYLATVEASASSSNTHLGTIKNLTLYGFSEPLFGSSSASENYAKKLFQTTLTATGGGEIVAANVGPPGLASYQACMILTHIYSDATTANMTFTIAPSAGAFDVGLTTMDISSTANTVAPDYNKGLAWQCGTDAATIQFAAAAGQCGAAQNITFCGVYWYET